jgi:kynurenine formamidase
MRPKEDQRPVGGGDIGLPDEVRAAARRVSNWGRWGDDDELGTLNHISPATVAHAATLIRSGKMFSLSVPLDSYGPQGAHGYRRNPIHLMSLDGGDVDMTRRVGNSGGPVEQRVGEVWRGPFRFNDDYIMMPLQAATQWDALSHGYYEEQLYNGFPADSVTSFGAARVGIDKIAEKGMVVGRGVLLDVARYRGVDQLEPLSLIEPQELQATAEAQGVGVGEGDIVLVRTGWWQRFLQTRDTSTWGPTAPGISWRCAEWLHERKVAAIAVDNFAVEAPVQEFPGVFLPFHMLALRDMGMPLGEIWDLEALGNDCHDDHVYEFMLVAQPLLVTGAVGSPVNPVALK